jgi:hypothetical protein
MSHERKENDAAALPPSLQPADMFLQQFENVVAHARRIAFVPWRKGVAAPPDMTGWSPKRRTAYAISSPWPTSWSNEMTLPPFMFLLWVIPLGFWAVIGDLWFDLLFGTYTPTNAQAEVSGWTWVDIRWIVYAVLALLFGVAAYWSWIEFARDHRYSRRSRAVLCVAFAIFVGSSPFWLLSPENLALFPNRLINNGASLIPFVVGYLLFVIPFLTFVWRFALDVLILGGRLFLILLASAQYLHEPIPRSLALQLVQGRNPTTQDEILAQPLADLPVEGLEWMERWAVTKRRSLEVTLLPLGILLAGVALFANTETFTDAVDTLVGIAVEGPSLLRADISFGALAGRLLLVAFVASLFVYAAYSLFAAFRNLVTYSLVIESCLAAEQVHQQDREVGRNEDSQISSVGWWQWLIRLFSKR